jgi:AcrR family transcriptional regulator
MRIREAFFQCLREKPVSRITVKELCDIAEINRATFYTHYRDPFDLLEKLEEETLAGLRRMISEREIHGEDGLLLTMLQQKKRLP